MRIDFVTIFPAMFAPFTAEGIIARGVKQKILDIRVWDLREFASDRHRSTDDEAYGGGPGMVMLAEPVLRCVDRLRARGRAEGIGLRAELGGESDGSELNVAFGEDDQLDGLPPQASALSPQPSNEPLALQHKPHIILTSPQGRAFTQAVARELAEQEHLVFLCGRYEGFDHRVHELLQPDEISIGDFVVSGGELPAMLMADAVGRMIPGVVGNQDSVEEDSFFHGLLDYPHYTRPEEVRGMRVPDVLLSGHHEKIRKWRKEQALRATLSRRPDLLESAELDDEAREILRRLTEF